MLNNLFGCFHFFKKKDNNRVNTTIKKSQYNDLNDANKLSHTKKPLLLISIGNKCMKIFNDQKNRPLVYEVHI